MKERQMHVKLATNNRRRAPNQLATAGRQSGLANASMQIQQSINTHSSFAGHVISANSNPAVSFHKFTEHFWGLKSSSRLIG
jgi:hypothetical protein